MIPESVIEAIKNSSLTNVIGDYQPEMQIQKNGDFLLLCPFHEEETPSFHIRPRHQSYHCYSCGEAGNTISFIMKKEGMSFVKAVEFLAKKLGMKINEDKNS
jgi:DNA primase